MMVHEEIAMAAVPLFTSPSAPAWPLCAGPSRPAATILRFPRRPGLTPVAPDPGEGRGFAAHSTLIRETAASWVVVALLAVVGIMLF
ncbi:MAG TPA: hypothetical protein VGV37_04060 [Aliidongia sp.]|uniref:hypothetical protein n=1 Tax=Aliidongia sp. TaxID=1914230 RepID=UPI002DDDA6F2|nr:hypothetical protein [Aliidongia sp.]HEV2673690.1 hypothetical protein [Aliidongia sp.]